MTTENVWSSAIGKKILPTIKGKHAALCLEKTKNISVFESGYSRS